VPWQITESPKSIHALAAMNAHTPKTCTARRYAKFIRPGSQGIGAEPGFDAVQVGAFLHEKTGDLILVALRLRESGSGGRGLRQGQQSRLSDDPPNHRHVLRQNPSLICQQSSVAWDGGVR